jgi:hypothetical protein
MSKCADRLLQHIQDIDFKYDMTKKDAEMLINKVKSYSDQLLKQNKILGDTNNKLTSELALKQATKKIKEEMKERIEQDKIDTRIRALVWIQKLNEMKDSKYDPKIIEQSLSGRGHKGTGTRSGAEAQENAFLRLQLSGKGSIDEAMNDLGNQSWVALSDPKAQEDIIDKNIKQIDTNDLNSKISNILSTHDANSRELLNKYGISTLDLPGRVTKQYHDGLKMLNPEELDKKTSQKIVDAYKKYGNNKTFDENIKDEPRTQQEKNDAAFEIWNKFIIDRLDKEKTFPDFDWSDEFKTRETMRSIFDKITSIDDSKFNNHSKILSIIDDMKDKRIELDEGYAKINSMRGYTLAQRATSKQRKLFFKDGSGWLEYAKKYGAGDLKANILRESKSNARKLMLVKNWGPNPQEMLNKVIDHLRNNNVKNFMPHEKLYNRMRYQMDYLTNEFNGTGDAKVQSAVDNIKSIGVITKMGSTLFHLFPDLVNQWRTLSTQFGETMPNKIENLINGALTLFGQNDNDRLEFLKNLGVMSDHLIGAHRYTDDMSTMNGTLSRMAQMELKWSGISGWDNLMRKTTYAAWGNSLARRSNLAFDNLDANTKNTLNSYGITDNEWNLWRSLSTNKNYLMPDDIYNATKDQLEKTGLDAQQLYHKFITMYHDSYRFTVPSNDLPIKAKLAQFSKNNPTWGPALSLLLQFKSYALGFGRNILARDIALSGSKMDVIKNLSSTIVGIMGVSYLGQLAKSLTLNQGMPTYNILSDDANTKKNAYYNWASAAMGSLGMYGDAINATTSNNTDLAGKFLGPGYSMATGILGFAHQIAGHAFNGNNYKSKKSATLIMEQLAQKNTPILNTPLATSVINYAIAKHIMDFIQPGSYEEESNALQKKYSTTPLI